MALREVTKPIPTSADMSGAGLRAYFRIAEAWQLNRSEQRRLLGDPPTTTFHRWQREGGELGRDVLERISYVLGIFKALNILFPDPAQADAWLKRPNTAGPFGGRSALERMMSGNVADLYVVRQYLDGERGG
jgi:hypothetical protein